QDVGGPADGLYLSQSFGPELTRDADRFHTLRYIARLGMSQSGTVRLVDAVTSEVMAQTPLRSGTNEWDLTGMIDLRDHPSIRLNITAGGLDVAGAFILDDLWVNWTPRSNQPPIVVDMWPGKPTVERTKTVELYVNVSDDYDDIGNLTVNVGHSLQGSGVWSSNLFHPTMEASYEGDLWVFYLNPPYNAELGNYTFRVNVTDLDNDHTGFITYPALLEVLPGLPSIPTDLVVTAMDSAVKLEWRSPRDTGDSPILGYRIFRGTSNDSLELISTVEPSNITYLDGTVENGVTYFYAVLAFTAHGNGELSEIIEIRPVGKPTAPLDLAAQMNEGQVILTWRAPESDGSQPVLDYYLYKGNSEYLLTWEVTVTGTEYTYTGLTKGEDYYFAVSARNVLGEGPMSSVVSATYVSLPSAPRDLTANGGILKVKLTWHSPNDNGGLGITGFVIYRGVIPGSLEELKTFGAAPSLYTDADVEGGITYYYSVAAMNSLGEGPMCEAVPTMPIGPPGAPGGLGAIEGDGQVTLTWTAPVRDGGYPVMGYVIMRGSSPDDLTSFSQVMDQLTYVDDDVTNGETYHYAVAAINDVGEGLLSAIAEATPFRLPTVPGTVRLLTGKVKDGKVELFWATPGDDGGTALTGYVVLRGSSADDMEVVATLGVVTSWTDEDAKRGRTYLYSVAALNEHGKGEPINEVEVKVPKKEEESPGFGLVAALA
ncbi:MAG: fibronectin type III domain-containing protein, partial [Thermoplasmata archaeon]|nr:fibronectin type III domain-containing protein [Thermoplasmata archaeon]